MNSSVARDDSISRIGGTPECIPANGDTDGRINPSAVFVRISYNNPSGKPQFSPEDWLESLGPLKDSSVEGIIVQAVAEARIIDNKPVPEWVPYFSNRDVVTSKPIYPPFSGNRTGLDKQLGYVLQAAKKLGLEVTIGLGVDQPTWFKPAAGWNNPDWLRVEADRAAATIRTIWAEFGADYAGTIVGWYLPYEIEGYRMNRFSGTGANSDNTRAYVDDYLAPTSRAAMEITDLPNILVSPLFSPMTRSPQSSDEFERLGGWERTWARVFSTTSVNIVAPQDGAGSGKTDESDIARWFAPLVSARDRSGTPGAQVWGNAENYRDQNAGITHMGVRQLSRNLAAMKRAGATDLIMFSIHVMDPRVPRDEPYARAYRAWVAGESAPKSRLGAPQDASISVGIEGDPLTTARVTWGASTPLAPVTLPEGASTPEEITETEYTVAGYQVRRDGRVIAEYPAEGPNIHLDHQLSPGRTAVYQVWAFDYWGTFSPSTEPLMAVVEWTGGALEMRDPAPSVDAFNLAFGAPYALSKTAEGVSVGASGIGPVSTPIAIDPAFYPDIPEPLAPVLEPNEKEAERHFFRGALTDGILGSPADLEQGWQGQYSKGRAGYWVLTLDLTSVNGSADAALRSIGTQWMHDPPNNVYAPTAVEAMLYDSSGTLIASLPAVTRARAGIGDKRGSGWYWHTAVRTIVGVTRIRFAIQQRADSWSLAGQVFVQNENETNVALGARYSLRRFNPAPLLYTLDGGAPRYPGTRSRGLTDGAHGPETGPGSGWNGWFMGAENGQDAFLTVDLGTEQSVAEVGITALRSEAQAIEFIRGGRVRNANADGTWGEWGPYLSLEDAPRPPQSTREHSVLPGAGRARFVQLQLRTAPERWLMLDSVTLRASRSTDVARGREVSNATYLQSTPDQRKRGTWSPTSSTPARLQVLTSGDPIDVAAGPQTSRWARSSAADVVRGTGTRYGTSYDVDLGPRARLIREVTTTWMELYGLSIILPPEMTVLYADEDDVTWHPFGSSGGASVPQELGRDTLIRTYRVVRETPVATRRIRIQSWNGSLKPWTVGRAHLALAAITAHESEPSKTS
ncbi:DUF4434 domain-containing protein [Mycetocola tolaasinivorans]|uniref:DUF4434 domain-containing protein n=1 Tax=Mycetocola tolaasinivorans TaxID=76635 RepID=A0A3L7A9M4_9MICO|nr:DUF4434 domain-containing protein [Mycetocola tolaasinivorans]RLP76784.1 DUF4434 domain-containing protein [Mycetocola tolaasinivorans]